MLLLLLLLLVLVLLLLKPQGYCLHSCLQLAQPEVPVVQLLILQLAMPVQVLA
jgi:hypothetical protein